MYNILRLWYKPQLNTTVATTILENLLKSWLLQSIYVVAWLVQFIIRVVFSVIMTITLKNITTYRLTNYTINIVFNFCTIILPRRKCVFILNLWNKFTFIKPTSISPNIVYFEMCKSEFNIY